MNKRGSLVFKVPKRGVTKGVTKILSNTLGEGLPFSLYYRERNFSGFPF
jgi:hypothetical protein